MQQKCWLTVLDNFFLTLKIRLLGSTAYDEGFCSIGVKSKHLNRPRIFGNLLSTAGCPQKKRSTFDLTQVENGCIHKI